MGLDMYLNGSKYLTNKNDITEDGFRLKERILELGYWHKHPNLHGYIVENFAGGDDSCQDIQLSEAQIQQIIEAVKNKTLPVTSGAFFGESDGSEDAGTIKTLEKAIKWLRKESDFDWRSVYYRASW